jgi:glycosyltransferase involved in cell wall biosynthesis
MRKIDIIVTSFKKYDELAVCLDSLSRQTLQNFRLIIMDCQGKEDEARRLGATLKMPYHWMISDEWFDVSWFPNLARKYVKARYMGMIDGDCFFPPMRHQKRI